MISLFLALWLMHPTAYYGAPPMEHDRRVARELWA